MSKKLIILIILAVIIVGVSVYSVFYYRTGWLNQYDEYIIEYSKLKGEQGLEPVDPAIVKAIITDPNRSNFKFNAAGQNGEKGLMFVSEAAVEEFLNYHSREYFIRFDEAMNKKELWFLCFNHDFPNHRDPPRTYVRAGVCAECGERVVQALFIPKINIRIGTWYLAYVTAYLKENIKDMDEEKIEEYAIEAYGYGIEMFEKGTKDLTDFSGVEKYCRENIERIKKRAEKLRPRIERKAREIAEQ